MTSPRANEHLFPRLVLHYQVDCVPPSSDGLKDHINMRIQHSGSKAKEGGIPETRRFGRILMVFCAFGPLKSSPEILPWFVGSLSLCGLLRPYQLTPSPLEVLHQALISPGPGLVGHWRANLSAFQPSGLLLVTN